MHIQVFNSLVRPFIHVIEAILSDQFCVEECTHNNAQHLALLREIRVAVILKTLHL